MYINTSTKETMEKDLAMYLNLELDELNELLDSAAEDAYTGWAFNQDIFDSKIETVLGDLLPIDKKGALDEILVYHLARRLEGTENDCKGENLYSLLSSNNSLTFFLEKYDIKFKAEDDCLALIYRNKRVPLDNREREDILYLRKRLGYNEKIKDYCFNGFALRDSLMNNFYARELYDGPEFLDKLSNVLKNKAIKEDFIGQSKYYCFTYRVPLKDVIFDGAEEQTTTEKAMYLLKRICNRLSAHMVLNPKDISDSEYENPVIRFADDKVVPEAWLVKKEEITLDMINS